MPTPKLPASTALPLLSLWGYGATCADIRAGRTTPLEFAELAIALDRRRADNALDDGLSTAERRGRADELEALTAWALRQALSPAASLRETFEQGI